MVVLQHLRRVRWAVRATLFLGVAASVVANVLHALDNPISQAIAAWPPLALLLTVELISRVPVHRRWLAAARLIATATIAGIAAWVSYWHMAGVASRYGETGASPYLLPLSVDGLIVVASICLVELGGRISTLERLDDVPMPAPAQVPAPIAAPIAVGEARPEFVPERAIPELIPTPAAATPARAVPAPAGRAVGGSPMDHRARAEIAAALSRTAAAADESAGLTPSATRQPRAAATAGRSVPAQRGTAASRAATSRAIPEPDRTQPGRTQPAQRGTTAPQATAGRAMPAQRGTTAPQPSVGKKERRSAAETVALANGIKAKRPSLTESEIAAELGISPSRWRTVRREAAHSDDHTLAA